MTWYESQIEKANINVLLEQTVTAETVQTIAPDAVIVASGASVFVPHLPGIDNNSVMTGVELLEGKRQAGTQPVVVGGGLAGCEIAIWLAEQEKRPLVIEALPELMTGGATAPMQVKMMTKDLLQKHQIEVKTDARLKEITADGILVLHKNASTETIVTDTVVLAIGMRPNNELADLLEQDGQRVYRIGDCREPRNIMNAVWDAYEIARWI